MILVVAPDLFLGILEDSRTIIPYVQYFICSSFICKKFIMTCFHNVIGFVFPNTTPNNMMFPSTKEIYSDLGIRGALSDDYFVFFR
jgi:hypothetical protein